MEPAWDFVVIDEAQDFTNVQLELVLGSLRDPRGFILCGDANQIVHPNFFSWSALKTFLYFRRDGTGNPGNGGNGRLAESRENDRFRSSEKPEEMVRVLTTNYRNSRQVTETANRILRLKHARFGSVDRESNHLVTSNAGEEGSVLLLPDIPEVTREIDRKTNASARHAVVVLHPEQKAGARERFRTPLVFTIQEAKGLEYDHVILYGFVSGDAGRFREIARGVEPGEVQAGDLEKLRYARARDKGDKSLEIFKFHINALYVAVTRAVRTIYLVEAEPRQRLFDLLGVSVFRGELHLEDEKSSLEEWRREARKLERQGKAEQAADIRERVLGVREVPWRPLDRSALDGLTDRVSRGEADRKSMLLLYEYALLANDQARQNLLAAAGYRPAKGPPKAGLRKLVDNHFQAYSFRHPKVIRTLVEKYGTDHRDRFNCTQLMLAARFGHEGAVEMLAGEMDADPTPVNSAGLTAFQILLQELSRSGHRTPRGLERMCRRLCPADVSVMVNERLVKLDGRKAEFLFFQIFVALFGTWMQDNVSLGSIGLRAADLVEILERMPDSVVPAYRKRQPYVSSVLARNEVDRDLPANRRLFRRTERGVYILNPEMSVRVEGEWVRIHDLLEPEVLVVNYDLSDFGPELREALRGQRKQWLRTLMVCLSPNPGRSPKTWVVADSGSGTGSRIS